MCSYFIMCVTSCEHLITNKVKMFKHLDSLHYQRCPIGRSTVTKLVLVSKGNLKTFLNIPNILFQIHYSMNCINNYDPNTTYHLKKPPLDNDDCKYNMNTFTNSKDYKLKIQNYQNSCMFLT